jgi:cell shape-determining protein MreC
LKLKRQTIQGDLDQSQQQKESQNAQLQQYKSLIQSLEAKNAELVDLLNTNKTKWN